MQLHELNLSEKVKPIMVEPLRFKVINMEKVYVHEYNVAINGILQKVK